MRGLTEKLAAADAQIRLLRGQAFLLQSVTAKVMGSMMAITVVDSGALIAALRLGQLREHTLGNGNALVESVC